MRHTATRIGKVAMAISILTLLALTPALFASTDFTVPPGRSSNPIAMILGPDGNLWFVESSNQKIGYITTAGSITEFSIPNAQSLFGIAKGSDGNIWFTDELAGTISHISTSGTGLVTYSLPTGAQPQGITTGPDGNLWFVDQYVNPQQPAGGFRIGSITVSGTVTEYFTGINPGPFYPTNLAPAQITKGPDGTTQPVVSTLNALDGSISSNMAIVPSTNGKVDAYASGITQLILDISSYFAP